MLELRRWRPCCRRGNASCVGHIQLLDHRHFVHKLGRHHYVAIPRCRDQSTPSRSRKEPLRRGGTLHDEIESRSNYHRSRAFNSRGGRTRRSSEYDLSGTTGAGAVASARPAQRGRSAHPLQGNLQLGSLGEGRSTRHPQPHHARHAQTRCRARAEWHVGVAGPRFGIGGGSRCFVALRAENARRRIWMRSRWRTTGTRTRTSMRCGMWRWTTRATMELLAR